MSKIRVWDPLVRVFHWSLVGLFAANALFVDDESELHIWIGHTVTGLVWMIYNLLFALLVIGASGYLMTTDTFWAVEWPEDLHEFAVGWAEVSVVMHIAAVIFESRRTRTNLPRAMVTGYKETSLE